MTSAPGRFVGPVAFENNYNPLSKTANDKNISPSVLQLPRGINIGIERSVISDLLARFRNS